MRIVHLIARLNDGGPARVVASLAGMMRARGHEVIVLTGTPPDDEADLAPDLAARGLALERVAGLGRPARPLADARAFARVRARLRALAPDVVHTHTAKAGALGRIACALDRRPCVHTYHGHVLDGYFAAPLTAVLVAAERLLARRAHLHALTAGQARELHGRFAIGTAGRWHALPPPVEAVTPRAAPWHGAARPGVARIGFLGRLAPVKDADLWLDVVARLASSRAVDGVVCGDGGEAARLRARAHGLPVRFAGRVPAAEALGGIDLLLMTSRNEGLPLAAVEAMSAGIPVVAPPVGGLADLARAGVVASASRDAAALAAACAGILDDAAARSALVARGAAFARALAPAALADRYDALYRRVHQDRCAG